GLAYHDLDVARLRYFGGSTNHWGGYCIPWQPLDFEVRPGIPLSGWPLSAEEVFPYYARAQEIAGLDGLGFSPADWMGPAAGLLDGTLRPSICLRTAGRLFALNHGPALRAAGNVTVLLRADVLELVATERADHVERVRVAAPGGGRFTVRAGTVVLATGGIENARLLLLSDGVRRDGLGNAHGWVGRCFMDHVALEAGRFLPSRPLPAGLCTDFSGPDGVEVRPLLEVSADRRRDEGLPRALVAIRAEGARGHASRGVKALRTLARQVRSGDLPDNLWHHLGQVLGDIDAVGALALERVLGPVATAHADAALEPATVDMFLELVPNPASRITLSEERDALGRRRASLDWRLSELDRHTVRRTLEIVGAELGRLGLGRLAPVPLEEEWAGTVTGSFHHMGTTRMAAEPRWGVVDRDCRVHGIDNLYIAGSSVFATGGSGTPTLFLTALAARLADHLKEQRA
ncbi:MAG TPA: GMC oxidoreductase, partial [Azospirillaceae bacterium]|nr:GMC oxidoreductase [Azospirillaceae bacterium]